MQTWRCSVIQTWRNVLSNPNLVSHSFQSFISRILFHLMRNISSIFSISLDIFAICYLNIEKNKTRNGWFYKINDYINYINNLIISSLKTYCLLLTNFNYLWRFIFKKFVEKLFTFLMSEMHSVVRWCSTVTILWF